MPRIPNEIARKWIESKYTRKINRACFWAVRADRSVAELTVRFNTECYHAIVADLLNRVALKMKKV